MKAPQMRGFFFDVDDVWTSYETNPFVSLRYGDN